MLAIPTTLEVRGIETIPMGDRLERFDVIVVGGGIAGASVAWHLRDRGRVLLLERGPAFGAEAASQNAGMVRLLSEGVAERTLAIRSERWMRRRAEQRARVDLFRRTGGVVALARETSRYDAAVRHLRESSVEVVPLARRPAALEGSPIVQAWHLPHAGVSDGHALVSSWLHEAKLGGVQARTRCPVDRLEIVDGDVRGVWSGESLIKADAVVIAAGAWSSTLVPGIALSPRARHLLVTAPHIRSSRHHPWCWVDDAGVYARPEGEGWLVSPCDQTPFKPSHETSWGVVESVQRAVAHDKLEHWMPSLADVRFHNGWTGVRTFAEDEKPVLGADPRADGLYWATALGGFGLSCGYAVGEYVAAAICGDSTSWLNNDEVGVARFLDSSSVELCHRLSLKRASG